MKSFADAAAMIQRPRIESVEVPYGGKSLPALFVHAASEVTGGRPGPALVFFDGFDVTKEIQYFKGVPDLVARGIAENRIETTSFGEDRPVDAGHTEEAWAKNRRTEFEVTAGGETLRAPQR